jgi:hypothetical protein
VNSEEKSKDSDRIKPKNLELLKKIIQQDYALDLNNDDLNHLGFSLLKITRLAMGAFNRSEEKTTKQLL